MSKYKDQFECESFKEKAKLLTKALVDKEIRRHMSKETRKLEINDSSKKAIKKYVYEYLQRHGIQTK
ncbi:hypothetical protein BC833DRAFT_592732 [Globomyces pollinis-pini]|nr:hypothetical protein BC833DRAFT_592732 [Globomyces pollinis-pini]